MKILVIIGDCLLTNSSANLCHLAYLRGLVDANHEVTLVSAKDKGDVLDAFMDIPSGIETHLYSAVTLYERLSIWKRKNKTSGQVGTVSSVQITNRKSSVRKTVWKLKRKIISLYGAHGIYSKFVSKAMRFRSKDNYDVVLSISNPPASHLLAYKLISRGHVKCGHWIQIWEDPWSGDVYRKSREKAFKEEKRILGYADRVCYVSPITLAYQKRLFPEAAGKMFWVPLPSYYELKTDGFQAVNDALFGYFGDYRSRARNLDPFYQAALSTGVEVNICGSTDLKLQNTEHIHIYPRLPLSELRPIEDQTGVLVFLCNRSGGQIPGKIYQYAATNKTILFILDGSEEEKRILKEYFEPFHRFVFCDNDVESIERAISSIQQKNLCGANNEPLIQFQPKAIVQRILYEGMN